MSPSGVSITHSPACKWAKRSRQCHVVSPGISYWTRMYLPGPWSPMAGGTKGGAPAIHRSSLARTLWLHLVPPIFQKPGDEVEQSESQPSADDRRNGKIKIPSATGDWRTSQGHNAIRAAALGWAPINRQTDQEASQEATAMHSEWGVRQHLNTWEETLHSNDRQVHAWMNHVLEHPCWLICF